ncbi:TPA: hypothetical protein VBK33_001914 [Streptococcus agalactiae]|uniref:hypothetical protein n=1 Tax=Streptococcus agalactiae TaxID=1311 RepID=UPI00027F04EC|nr:hypothetical protein [Streptococcus agalactiae]AFQ95911.1 hypothetical protein [Streptococcus phage LYGO9]AFQ95984.1 hypothetical protein [Streptococcus phage JX01]AYJ74973.1 putative capsid protein [Streptococcus phage LF2]EPU31614.1 hypothetical protein SAG0146_05080 [Streptococcus agalactiae MRI Z1-039]EPT81758.1 hypothetical protein SAG0087_06125 [Streptococcus agalactiae LMG 15091]
MAQPEVSSATVVGKPTKDSTIEDIKKYLTSQNIDFSGKTLKADLLKLAGVEEV